MFHNLSCQCQQVRLVYNWFEQSELGASCTECGLSSHSSTHSTNPHPLLQLQLQSVGDELLTGPLFNLPTVAFGNTDVTHFMSIVTCQ
jgi:hypothetical protein